MRRFTDILVSGVLLLITAPVFFLAALAIWSTDRGSVFFQQTRVGLGGRPFVLWKFRSMRINSLPAVVMGQVRSEHPMVTTVGKWLRRFKIDELPQLLNVLRGDMTLIGPRPTVLEQVKEYTAFQRRRLDVLPGMTGWAQVNGGVEISWPERILLDVWYVDHRSLWLYLKIMWRTITVVLFGEAPDLVSLEEAIRYARQQAGEAEVARFSVALAGGGNRL